MKWTEAQVVSRTRENVSRIKRFNQVAADLLTDPKREQRLADRLCLYDCYAMRGRIVGHGFTDWSCSVCDKPATHVNTGVPKVCDACADERGLCVQCGGLREPFSVPDKRRST